VHLADGNPGMAALPTDADVQGMPDVAIPQAFGTETAVVVGPRSRRSLMVALVAWDAIIPVAVLGVTSRIAAIGPAAIGNPAGRLALLLGPLAPPTVALAGGYDHVRRREDSRLSFGMRLLTVGLLLSWIGALAYGAAGLSIRPGQMIALTLLLPGGWLLGRWACDHHPAVAVQRVLLVGSGEQAERIVTLIGRHRERRMSVVGRIDAQHGRVSRAGDGPPFDDLAAMVVSHRIDRIIVAFSPERDSRLLGALRDCLARGVAVDIVPRFFDLVGPRPRSHALGALTLVRVPARGLTGPQRAAKRAVDILGAAILIVLLAPIAAVVAALVAARDGRPILYRQERVGRDGRRFPVLKFRTMRAIAHDEPPSGDAIADVVREIKAAGVARVTPLGRFLRQTSLDELPQLVNVLLGQMSLVGPRPLRPFEVEALCPWQRARQELRPGLTGLWQVLGRSGVDWDERIQLDYSYVAHWSLASDLRILARTLPAILRKDGAV
jgi:exopolysaccharide biosynthesis polyprenyl glycosylphosphotransferase